MTKRKTLSARQKAAETALSSILGRLERLESIPQPTVDLEPVQYSLTELRTEVHDMVRSYEAQQKRLDDLEAQARDFTIALSEGIERYGRAERRIKATVQRARKELAERGLADPGLEAEDHELRDVDGSGSEESGVLPMRPPVGEPVREASSIKGVTIEQLQRLRGYR